MKIRSDGLLCMESRDESPSLRLRYFETVVAPLRTHSEGEHFMKRKIAHENFEELKGHIKKQWSKLNDDEIDASEGHAEILAGKLQERYGWELDEAERQVKEFASRHGWQ